MKTQEFADLITKEQVERRNKEWVARNGYEIPDFDIPNHTAKVIEGKKYIKIDVGGSGKYMIDQEGNIFGIKAYGVIHKGHYYGTLDTMNQYYWGDYVATRKGII